MKETLNKIRELLDDLETNAPAEEPSFRESFQLLELPELVASIVDYLQPALLPYEAAIYWYMFRHSIIATGDVFGELSPGELQDGVIKSFRVDSAESQLALATVRDALRGLVTKGAVSAAGDINNAGTPYRIHLPEEIALCREAMSKAQQEQLPKVDPKRELDFYNIKENRLKVLSGTNTCAIIAGSCLPNSAQRSITFNRFPKAATILTRTLSRPVCRIIRNAGLNRSWTT